MEKSLNRATSDSLTVENSEPSIKRISHLSASIFFSHYYNLQTPVILTEMIEDSPIMSLWSPDYFKQKYGNVKIEIMDKRNSNPNYEIEMKNHKKLVRFKDYIDRVVNEGESNDCYMVANNGSLQNKALKSLLKDIDILPEFLEKSKTKGNAFFWFGSAGTITPLHYDNVNIFMAQIYGRKKWTLIPPNCKPFLYNHIGVYSQIDCENPDYNKYPLFKKVKPIEVVLEPGEILFIPAKWWHHVKALDISISLSFTNFISPKDSKNKILETQNNNFSDRKNIQATKSQRYLLYKDYESGFNNELMSLELAVGLAYLTKRKLVYYGSLGEYKQLKPIRGGNFWNVPLHRKHIINNNNQPTIFDLLEELPIERIEYLDFSQKLQSNNLTINHSNLQLVNSVFVSNNTKIDRKKLDNFAEGRTIFQDSEEDILHLSSCNLGYYSRFFYNPSSELYAVLEKIKLKKVYRNLALKIANSLGNFNGVHIRLTDFKNCFPQEDKKYAEEIIVTLKNNFSSEELLVICTDESENKEFFAPIIKEYKNCIFLDEFIVNEFGDDFQKLPFTDETTFGMICNLVMWNSQDFIGTPGSTYSGIIHRNWLRNKWQKKKNPALLEFKYINSGFKEKQTNFKNGVYQKTKLGVFSWNRIDLPIPTETKSWYREWPESVIPRLPVSLKDRISLIRFNNQKLNQQESHQKNNNLELLLLCAKNHINSTNTENLKKILSEDLNWERVVHTASQHRVMPLLYWNLKHTFPEAVPQNILSQIEQDFHTNALHNLLLTKELHKVLNLFKANGISAIPFKGAVLAADVYRNLAMRQFSDLDILVRKEDMLEVQDLLLSQGYVLQRSEYHLTQNNQNNYLYSQHRYDEWYWKTLDQNSLFGVRVEIHWETTPKHIIFPLNLKKSWQQLEPISISDMTFPTLSPEFLLPILCVNYAKDHWIQLKMICDIAQLIHINKKLDWEKAVDYARSLGRKRTLFIGLFLAHDLLGSTLPLEIWQQMQADLTAKTLAQQVQKRIFLNNGNHPPVLENILYNLRMREHFKDKIRYFLFSSIKVFEQIFLRKIKSLINQKFSFLQ